MFERVRATRRLYLSDMDKFSKKRFLTKKRFLILLILSAIGFGFFFFGLLFYCIGNYADLITFYGHGFHDSTNWKHGLHHISSLKNYQNRQGVWKYGCPTVKGLVVTGSLFLIIWALYTFVLIIITIICCIRLLWKRLS